MENQTQNPEEFFEKLTKRLENTTEFPAEYLYKFIVPNQAQKIEQLKEIFKGKSAEITLKDSSAGKYTAVSVRLNVQNPEEVIHFYKEAAKVDGIVSL